MAVNWTDEQKEVINTSGRDLLVSAAAGSGKTAVLVERIIRIITDPADPVPVTSLLIVTFTRAAAAEMRERLNERLSALMKENPEDPVPARQAALLPQANISTIDSFCQWLVRQYFFLLDMDPDLRIAEEGEDLLLKEDCLTDILQAGYEAAEPDFVRLMNVFTKDMNDRTVRDMILELHRRADSMPWPERWIESLLAQYDGSAKTFEQEEWFKRWGEDARRRLAGIKASLMEARREAGDCPGLEKYMDMFSDDIILTDSLASLQSDAELYAALKKPSFTRMPSIKKTDGLDVEKQELLKAWRNNIKKEITSLSPGGSGDIMKEQEYAAATDPLRHELASLTLQFMQRYSAEKKKRDLATFSDIEHFALNLLWRWEDGIQKPAPLQHELKSLFREVMTDEYQDSNLVQEEILRAFAADPETGDGTGASRFMVGDVKQSIYRFRMARPELFMQKYHEYTHDRNAAGGYCIDLGRNFRSRKAVLDAANGVFRGIMSPEFGGIAYDERAALVCGASYEGDDPAVELLVLDGIPSASEGVEAEARMIADKIRELIRPETGLQIKDSRSGQMRPVKYSDIVVLVRSAESMAEPVRRILTAAGIPAYAQESKGYFSAMEVQVLLSFLKILDDPLQDIPLASVLLSPIGGFTKEQIAFMCAGEPDGFLMHRLQSASAAGRCTEKFEAFRTLLEKYRKLSGLRPIHELLLMILQETDYMLALMAEPGGAVRKANVEMLIQKAVSFEETSYRGIFRFIRYIERLHDYKVDQGEAMVLSESEDLVRISTIHKSKGMEYPVVFVAGTGRSFNLMDAMKPMLIHQDLGLACDLISDDRRSRLPLLYKKTTAAMISRESREEELRVLYVAMTRAKEKLILTGCTTDLAKKMQSFAIPGFTMPMLADRADSYLDWILTALSETDIRVTVHPFEEDQQRRGFDRELALERAGSWLAAAEEGVRDEEFSRLLHDMTAFAYPYKAAASLKGAVSVSELKKAAMPEEAVPKSETPGDDVPEEKPGETAAREMEAGRYPVSGAARGTAFHQALRWLTPEECGSIRETAEGIRRLAAEGLLGQEEASLVDPKKIYQYYASPLGKTAAAAHKEGRLYREQKFIKKLPADVFCGIDCPEEWVVLQGIIDAYAVTDEGIILWDYKTDHVSGPEAEAKLTEMYAVQLKLYAGALQDALNKPVKEIYIYSFALGKAIRI